jgi:hypothetical protein
LGTMTKSEPTDRGDQGAGYRSVEDSHFGKMATTTSSHQRRRITCCFDCFPLGVIKTVVSWLENLVFLRQHCSGWCAVQGTHVVF